MRYFLRLAYCGTPFHGWQIQPHDNSVQETLEKALSTALRTPIAVTGAGRTDTGVHAATMIAHFDVDQPIADAHQFLRQINAMVGYDIAVQGICAVHPDAHARFDAVSRTYKYYLHTEKNPFLGQVSWFCHYALDFEQMNLAAQRLLQYIDFTSFSKLHTDVKTNNCRITRACWAQEGNQWVFTITADRFLRNMVRAIVGTLVEVGRERITVDDFCRIIERKDRRSAGQSMPGHALFLHDIQYPYPLEFRK